MSAPALSIVIVNYNTFKLTTLCIQSIQEETSNLSYEIILVDNGSVERDPEGFLSKFPAIRLIKLKENVGFACGNNAGIAVARAPVILLLNSDTKIVNNAIEHTYHFLQQDNAVGLVGCKLLSEDGTEQLSSYIPTSHPLLNLFVGENLFLQKFISFTGLFRKYGNHLDVVRDYQKQNHFCEAVSGAFMMLKTEVVKQCGAFDPDFFLYAEETEWCRNRIRKKFRIMYYAEAAIIHFGGKSSRSELVHKQMMLSSFLYSYKVGRGFYTIVFLIYLFNTCSNVLALPLLKRETFQIIREQQKAFFKIMKDLVFNIPAYSNRYGSRPAPLRIKEYQR